MGQRTPRIRRDVCRDCGTTDGMDWWHGRFRVPQTSFASRCRPCYNAYTLGNYHRRTGKAPRPPALDRLRGRQTCPLGPCEDCGRPARLYPHERNATLCVPCRGVRVERRRSRSQARRWLAEKRGAAIHWRDLGERDGWVCHLCGLRVQELAGTAHEPLGATVDHLIPIAEDGEHEWANVALAHRRCNISRGARGMVQLRLAA